jgi:hypothetical protein
VVFDGFWSGFSVFLAVFDDFEDGICKRMYI